MILTLINKTGSTKTYLSGAISIAGNSSLSVTDTTKQFSLGLDGALRSDIELGNIQVSDGTNTFGSVDAQNYLFKFLQILASTSDNVGNGIGSISSGGINSLAVAQSATNYAVSSVNSSTTQLAAGATFTGVNETTFNQQSYSILLTSDQPGILTINNYINQTDTIPAGYSTFNVEAGEGFMGSGVVNGNWVNVTFKNIGSATTTTFNINTTYGTIPSATALNNAPMALQETNGIPLTATPYGNFSVSPEATALFSDTFDSSGVDTINRWTQTIAGTSSGSQALGTLTLSTGTTASNAIALTSQYVFPPTGINFLNFGVIVQVEASILTNTHRFWGFGTPNGTFTATTPLLNAVGFEIDTSGNFNAVVYSNGTKIVSQNLNLYKNYIAGTPGVLALVMRADSMYWFVGQTQTPVASSFLTTPDSFTLPIRLHMINNSTPPSSAPTYKAQALGVGDSGGNSRSISDGQYQWRKTNVSLTSALRIVPEASSSAIQGNAYSVILDTVAINSAESALLYFSNPSANTKNMYLTNIVAGPDASTNNWVKVRINLSPTITANGTAKTPININTGTTNTSSISVYTASTYSAKGSQVYVSATPGGSGLLGGGGGGSAGGSIDPCIVLTPGKSLLITGLAQGNNTASLLSIFWFEA